MKILLETIGLVRPTKSERSTSKPCAAVSLGAREGGLTVGAFGAGGQGFLVSTFDADERQDELAFALLAEDVKYSATIFDLRPLRLLLHGVSPKKRSPLETNLIYWADSYDALICYKAVTPLML
jgi:hypothetical protein